MKAKVLLCAAAAALSLCGAGSALAQSADGFTAGSILVRVRALHFESVNKDSTGLGLSINNKWVTPAEVDLSYFLSPNWAAELVLAVPQKFHVYSFDTAIGSVRALPPTLLAQYHFDQMSGFKPYVGAGINYTRFSSVNILDGAATIKKNSFGPALQVGTDVELAKNIYLNLDVKKVWMRTKVSAPGLGLGEIGTLRLDPWMIGVGIGYRF